MQPPYGSPLLRYLQCRKPFEKVKVTITWEITAQLEISAWLEARASQ